MQSTVIDLEDGSSLAWKRTHESASLALAKRLQAEEDAASAAAVAGTEPIILPCKRSREAPLSGRGIDLAASTSAGAIPAMASPLGRLRLDVAQDVMMRAVSRELQAYDVTMCADEACMARQFDTWTCGYENLSSLLRSIGRRQLHSVPADLRPPALQRVIEEAWRDGFSPRDKTKLVGTRKWIGGPEWIIALWHLRLNALIIEVAGDGRSARGPGGAGHAVAAAVRTCLACCTDLPILLQHQGHSRTVLGVLARPCRLVLRDPNDQPGELRCVPPSELDGKQYQIVVVRNRSRAGAAVPVGLSADEARGRRGEPSSAAVWTAAGWEYEAFCKMRFD